MINDYKSDLYTFEEQKQKGKLYRDLGVTTAELIDQRAREQLTENYQERLEKYENDQKNDEWALCGDEPFILKNGYSSLLTNTYLLQRFEPYSSFFMQTQSADPGRNKCCFHDLFEGVHKYDSNQELIPEFFFLPELYQNRNHYFTGLR